MESVKKIISVFILAVAFNATAAAQLPTTTRCGVLHTDYACPPPQNRSATVEATIDGTTPGDSIIKSIESFIIRNAPFRFLFG